MTEGGSETLSPVARVLPLRGEARKPAPFEGGRVARIARQVGVVLSPLLGEMSPRPHFFLYTKGGTPRAILLHEARHEER